MTPSILVRRDGLPVRAGAAAGAWACVNLAAVLIVAGAPPSAVAAVSLGAVLMLTAGVTAVAVGLLAKGREWSFVRLVLVAAPIFWVLRALASVPLG